jgi:hypothetical protein
MAQNDEQNNQVYQFYLPLVSPFDRELDQCNIRKNSLGYLVEHVHALDLSWRGEQSESGPVTGHTEGDVH